MGLRRAWQWLLFTFYCIPSDDGLILDSKNTILLEGLRQPSTSLNYELVEDVLSVMYITDSVGLASYA